MVHWQITGINGSVNGGRDNIRVVQKTISLRGTFCNSSGLWNALSLTSPLTEIGTFTIPR